MVWRMRWAHESTLLVPLLFAAAAIGLLVYGRGRCAARRASRVVTDGAAWAGACRRGTGRRDHSARGSPGAPHAFLAALIALAGVLAAGAVHRPALDGGRGGRSRRLRRGRGRTRADVLGGSWTTDRHRRAGRGAGRRLALRRRSGCGWPTSRGRASARSPAATSSPALPANPKTRSRRWRTDRPHDITLRGEQVAAAARKSNPVLTGVLLGVAAVGVPASWFAMTPGDERQWASACGARRRRRHSDAARQGISRSRHAITLVAIAVAVSDRRRRTFTGCMPRRPTPRRRSSPRVWPLASRRSGWWPRRVVPPRVFSPPVRKIVEYTEYLCWPWSCRSPRGRSGCCTTSAITDGSATRGARTSSAAAVAALLLGANVMVPAAAVAIEPPGVDPAALPPDDTPGPDQEMKQQNTCAAPVDRGDPGRHPARAGQRHAQHQQGVEVLHRRGVTVGDHRHRRHAQPAIPRAVRRRRLRDGRRERRPVRLRYARHRGRLDHRGAPVRPGRQAPAHAARRRATRRPARRRGIPFPTTPPPPPPKPSTVTVTAPPPPPTAAGRTAAAAAGRPSRRPQAPAAARRRRCPGRRRAPPTASSASPPMPR